MTSRKHTGTPPAEEQPDADSTESRLDEALEESFPASDPIAVHEAKQEARHEAKHDAKPPRGQKKEQPEGEKKRR
ncbi:MAG TPA: hypothetical protein VF573_09170 [Paraburkholderia sp.]|uniref:hypothetical protein n=1 Tax=Paraburkholderia sp. TaxID=1926495 RepID=UPI002ED43CB9